MSTKKENGLVQVFTGNGKGKTTAALGTAIRAAGHGYRVFIVFFMKGKRDYGEYASLARLPDVTVTQFGSGKLIDRSDISQFDKEQARQALAVARDAVTGGAYDLVVMDEVNIALFYGLIDIEDVIRLLKSRPPHVEVILTGRYADDRVLEMADLVTEMTAVKHPYEKGIGARKGIEY